MNNESNNLLALNDEFTDRLNALNWYKALAAKEVIEHGRTRKYKRLQKQIDESKRELDVVRSVFVANLQRSMNRYAERERQELQERKVVSI